MPRQAAHDRPQLPTLLTVNDLAKVLMVSRRTVYRFVEAGDLPAVLVGDRLRFRPEDIAAYLERNKLHR